MASLRSTAGRSVPDSSGIPIGAPARPSRGCGRASSRSIDGRQERNNTLIEPALADEPAAEGTYDDTEPQEGELS